MKIKQVWGIFWSATGNTRKVVDATTEALAETLDCPRSIVDFTQPTAREPVQFFGPEDLVVVGSPTYAGKLPNKMLPDFQTKLAGGGALAVAIVTFGNRSFDNSLAELCATLEADGFHTVAGAACVGRHAFTDALANGRPDGEDLKQVRAFAGMVAEKVRNLKAIPTPVAVEGDEAAPYYIPKDTDGQPAKFLKAKPLTDMGKCCGCGVCAQVCPMGAIDPQDISSVPGVCIKCQACVRSCTRQAKYFEDPAFLSHVAMLEQNFIDRKENRMFL